MARWQKPHHDCAFHTHSSNCDGRIYHPAMWTLRFAAPANCSAHHLLSTHATAIVRRKIVSIGRKGRFRCCNRTVVVRYKTTKVHRYFSRNKINEPTKTQIPQVSLCRSPTSHALIIPQRRHTHERLLRTGRSRKRRSFVPQAQAYILGT